MGRKKAEVFLSYCWEDEKIADGIYDKLIRCKQIRLHRDRIEIKQWDSIKQYMQSIAQMDYTILLISDAYLKSPNCMYEVLEVMKDNKYKDKIFPAVVNAGIYDPVIKAGYVRYWQDKCSELSDAIKDIDTPNLGSLVDEIRHRKNIVLNIAEFLGIVSDMNNPRIDNISEAIENKLIETNIIDKEMPSNIFRSERLNIYAKLGIDDFQEETEITELDINQFMVESYNQICYMFEELCKEFETRTNGYKVIPEMLDTRNSFFQIYKNGGLVTRLKISLDSSFGENIGISNNSFSLGNSWNGLYCASIKDGKLMLKPLITMSMKDYEMSIEDVVEDIWESYVKPYLK